MTVTGWKLNEVDRAALLRRFPPAWPNVIADHVTLDVNAGPRDIFPQGAPAQIVGGIGDGDGVQAMVVSIGGTTDRPTRR